MKMLLLGIVVIGAIALGIWTYHFQRREPSPDSSTLRVAVEKKAVPMVMVWFVSLDHPGTGDGTGVPQVDGYVGGERGSGMYYSQGGSYKMVANPSGKFFVLAHYHVEDSGGSTEYDLALPVYEKKPDATKWAKLDSHCAVFAFLNGGTINY